MFRVQSQLLPASLNAIREEMARAFGDGSTRCSTTAAVPKIPLSLWENESSFTVEYDLPGFQRDDIDIQVEDGHLSVEAQRQLPDNVGECRHCDRQFVHGQRKFELPESVLGSDVEASLADGVLRIVLPKRPESKPQRIQIAIPAADSPEVDRDSAPKES